MQPEVWRMSKKDGKAVLLQGVEKKQIHQLNLPEILMQRSREVAEACPVRVIKIT
jgi:ferredoxin